mgnify:FL=1
MTSREKLVDRFRDLLPRLAGWRFVALCAVTSLILCVLTTACDRREALQLAEVDARLTTAGEVAAASAARRAAPDLPPQALTALAKQAASNAVRDRLDRANRVPGAIAGAAAAQAELQRKAEASQADSPAAAQMLLARVLASRAAEDAVDWEALPPPRSPRALLKYLSAPRLDPWDDTARAELLIAQTDPAAYMRAAQDGSASALKAFLVDYPGHPREVDAVAQLAKHMTAGLLDELTRARHIDLEVTGNGIQSATVRIRNKTGLPAFALAPVGTLFLSGSAAVQNMVSTQSVAIDLNDSDWQTVEVPVACANRTRAVPDASKSLTAQTLSRDDGLTRAAQAVSSLTTSFSVRQAAIWIVSDNATFAELGLLVSSTRADGRDATRVISEAQAAEALRLLHEAGISTRGRHIWQDRARIAAAITDPSLSDWLLNARPK